MVVNLSHDLSSIINALLKLLANIDHGQSIVLFKERNFQLQVHAEIKLVFVGLISKLSAHNLSHPVWVSLLHPLKSDFIQVILLVQIGPCHSFLLHVKINRLIQNSSQLVLFLKVTLKFTKHTERHRGFSWRFFNRVNDYPSTGYLFVLHLNWRALGNTV
jgi:hypothetical protein